METSASNEVSITKITIKKENLNDEIKEFAETAMNELLGWYGYDNRQEESRKSRTCRSNSGSNSSEPESPKFTEGCGWCGKTVEENTGLTSTMATFCSELCFSQSRRANFKKNKTCDWCHHVRNTISYVDFQDGASQLQFCSDKCLNQYKMHIFCRETRAHLDLHPHLYGEEPSSGTLITPDLWMKNCKSPQRRSPSPPSSPKAQDPQPQTSPLPLISVAHPSKLMSPSITESKRTRIKMQKKTRKRCASTVTNNFDKLSPSDTPQDLRIRHTPTDFEKARTIVKENLKTNHSEKVLSPSPIFLRNTSPDPRLIDPHLLQTDHSVPVSESPPRKPFDNLLPPPTILVPYPIILPVPIPIPIPIPIIKKDNKEKSDSSSQTDNVDEEQENSSQKEVAIELDEVKHKIGRPLRKRRRIVGEKSKVVTKYKKIVLNSN